MINIKNLNVVFKNNIVLENINLKINKNEIVAIIGKSGSGKSTLIRCINRLVKPTSGEIYFKNVLISDDNIDEIRQHIGMVFQQFELFPHLNVLENLILAPVTLKKYTKEEAEKLATKYLSKVNLLDKINSYPNTLSGGQKQRIAIIRALLMEPEIMLFDEPTSALDPEMVKEVLDVIKDLANSGMTICIVTHELSFAKEVATRVIFVDDKHIVEDGEAKSTLTKPKTKQLKQFLSSFQK